MDLHVTFGCLLLVFSFSVLESKPVENGYCPTDWVEFDGHCLFRPTIQPDDVCHQFQAKSVLNLFCIKDMKSRPIKKSCPPQWLEYHDYCLYVPTGDAPTYCTLHKSMVAFNSICIKGITENLIKFEDNEKTIGGQSETKNHVHVKQDERACCPNGFGK